MTEINQPTTGDLVDAADESSADPTRPDSTPPDPTATEPEPEFALAEPTTPAEIAGSVEALLLLAEEPMSELTLAQIHDVPVAIVQQCLADLATFYDETGRGFELRHLGGGWRYYTRAEHADIISRYVLEGQQSRLSQAALETLAVVAYQQPISRARIAAIRGVNVDGVIRTLLARGLVAEAGQDDSSSALIFRTTDYFLERMGLTSLDELPELAPHLPDVDELEAELGQLAAAAETNATPHPEIPPANEQESDQVSAAHIGGDDSE